MFESRRPEARAPHLRWSYIKLAPGTNFKGWIAGPLVGVPGHWDNSHKPCRAELTDGKLPCRYCKAEFRLRWLGYQPLYDEQLRQVVIGIGADLEPSVSQIPLHFPVRVFKGKSPVSPVIIRGESWATGLHGPKATEHKIQRIHEWLLKLWGDEELGEMMRETVVVEPPPAPTPPIAERDLPKARAEGKRELEAGARLLKKRLGKWTMSESTPGTEPTGKESPERNGTH